MESQISVVMVDGGFRENFRSLDFWLDQTIPQRQYELIWVEYTGRVSPEVQRLDRIRTFCLNHHDEPQVLARAYNEGIRRARGEIVVLPDADVACEPDLLEVISAELSRDPDLVLYVLRLDQPAARAREAACDLDHLRDTCSIKHTYNYGGCTAVRREHLVAMNGYEELPIFSGYHYNGGDNYIRFKNMGLKVRWHPTQRVYHGWHPTPPNSKFQTVDRQERFIRQRAASWDWLAYRGLDATRNREYDPAAPLPGDWDPVTTERGILRQDDNPIRMTARPRSLLRRIYDDVRRRGFIRGALRLIGTALGLMGNIFVRAGGADD